jgi:hypothetical protein
LVERTIKWEPSAYWWKSDSERSRATYLVWAKEAWAQEGEGCASASSGPDFKAGFLDGFVDYVYAGGTGEPPPLPPRPFWNMDLRLPAGRERANQWFAGYREGARVARDSGYRALAQVQSSLGGPPIYGGPGAYQDEPYENGPMGSPGAPAAEELPSQTPSSIEAMPHPDDQTPGEPVPDRAPATTSPAVTPPRSNTDHSSSFDGATRAVPEDIHLPNIEAPADGPAPANPLRAPAMPSDSSAARSRPVRLTSGPQFTW